MVEAPPDVMVVPPVVVVAPPVVMVVLLVVIEFPPQADKAKRHASNRDSDQYNADFTKISSTSKTMSRDPVPISKMCREPLRPDKAFRRTSGRISCCIIPLLPACDYGILGQKECRDIHEIAYIYRYTGTRAEERCRDVARRVSAKAGKIPGNVEDRPHPLTPSPCIVHGEGEPYPLPDSCIRNTAPAT